MDSSLNWLPWEGCLLDLVRDSARKLAWFDRLYFWAMRIPDWAKQWLNRQPAMTIARKATAAVRQRLKSILMGATGERNGRFKRKILVAKMK
jgi:hypothetical protein